MRKHTRNQRRMYRIHKQDEKILEQELLISSLQNQLQQKENIIKEVREYIDLVETLAINDKRNIFSMSIFKRILDKGE